VTDLKDYVIDLYLKDSAFVLDIVFIVPSRHEWVCSYDEIGAKRRRCEPAPSKFDTYKPGGA